MQKYKLKWVDNARFIAVLGVLSFHFWLSFTPPKTTLSNLLATPHDILMLPFRLGWISDFLFFAISGLGLGLSAARNRKGWGLFFVDRASKIYIAYWVTIILMFAYQGLALSVGTWDRLFVIPSTWGGWLQNVLLIPQSPMTMFSTHFWFLPALLTLYLAFPLLFRAIDRFGVVGFAVCLVAASVARYLPINLGSFAYAYTSFAWSPSFVIGAFIGIMLARHPVEADRWLVRTIPLGVLCLVLGTITAMNDHYVWLTHPLMGFGTLSVAGALGRLPWHLPRLTAISFEVYLVHMPFTGWYRHFFGFVTEPKPLFYAFFLISVTAMGAGVHWVVSAVEAKLRRRTAIAVTQPSATLARS